MQASYDFYSTIGLTLAYGGPDAEFSSFRLGESFLNLQWKSDWPHSPAKPVGWGRFILWVASPDDCYEQLRAAGYQPLMPPADAPWNERYFHILDPSGHEVSIARPLGANS